MSTPTPSKPRAVPGYTFVIRLIAIRQRQSHQNTDSQVRLADLNCEFSSSSSSPWWTFGIHGASDLFLNNGVFDFDAHICGHQGNEFIQETLTGATWLESIQPEFSSYCLEEQPCIDPRSISNIEFQQPLPTISASQFKQFNYSESPSLPTAFPESSLGLAELSSKSLPNPNQNQIRQTPARDVLGPETQSDGDRHPNQEAGTSLEPRFPCERGCDYVASSSKDRDRHHGGRRHRPEVYGRFITAQQGTFQCACGHSAARRDNYMRHVRGCNQPCLSSYRCAYGHCHESKAAHLLHLKNPNECGKKRGRPSGGRRPASANIAT